MYICVIQLSPAQRNTILDLPFEELRQKLQDGDLKCVDVLHAYQSKVNVPTFAWELILVRISCCVNYFEENYFILKRIFCDVEMFMLNSLFQLFLASLFGDMCNSENMW